MHRPYCWGRVSCLSNSSLESCSNVFVSSCSTTLGQLGHEAPWLLQFRSLQLWMTSHHQGQQHTMTVNWEQTLTGKFGSNRPYRYEAFWISLWRCEFTTLPIRLPGVLDEQSFFPLCVYRYQVDRLHLCAVTGTPLCQLAQCCVRPTSRARGEEAQRSRKSSDSLSRKKENCI